MNRFAYLMLLGLAFVLPFEDSIMIPAVGSIGRLFTALLMLSGMLALFVPGGIRLRRPSLFLLLAGAYTLWSVASIFWTVDQSVMLVQAGVRVQLLLLVFFTWQLLEGEARQLGALQAYVLGSTAAAISAILNYLAGAEAVFQRYSVSGVDPNEFATFLALGIPAAWFIILSGRHRNLFWPTLLFIPLALLGILLTSSRGGALVALVALSAVPLTLSELPSGRKRSFWFAAILAAAGLTLAAPQLVDVFESSIQRLASTSQELTSGTLNERSELWNAGLDLYEQHSLLGVGAGAFARAVGPYAGTENVAHNTYISVLVELGPLGLLLLLSILLSVGLPLLRLPAAQQVCYLILLLTLVLGMLPLTWEGRKITWFMLTLITAAGTLVLSGRSRPALEGHDA